ncbi:MAG: PilZ domain-containing protein [Deltaproteobacteria bacterium]|nr:PilZ domain-containing protein [Deltaproteobacteria bacterium]
MNCLDTAQRIDKKTFTNKLNHIHFTGGYLLFHLIDPQYEEDILIRACPGPFLHERITCQWFNDDFENFQHYHFKHLIIVDGLSVTVAPVKIKNITKSDFSIEFPNGVYSVGKRQAKRYQCRNIFSELNQSGLMARGTLIDFSSLAFRIRSAPDPQSSFLWFNAMDQITISLYRYQELIFSGPCRCIRETHDLREKEVVLSPVNTHIMRFKKKPARNPRVKLKPPVYVTFTHPFFHTAARLDVHDIAISGLSVREKSDESCLVPGMILSNLNIAFSGILQISCKAQVVYRRTDKKGYCRCGIAFLDMDIVTYRRLSNIIINSVDSSVRISDSVDIDGLWEFFFNTGFIYPKKYDLIQANRDIYRDTYKRLYRDKPEIAMHITYQKNGKIYGHASMVRAYERTWMFHHLAAYPFEKRHTGLPVLRQILHYLSGLSYLPSVKFNYLMFYFRPENRFPNYFFGDLVRDFKDPRRCSLDLFSYKSYMKPSSAAQLPRGWSLKESELLELSDLERFYNHCSGGLLFNALNLKNEFSEDPSLEKIYEQNGLIRRCKTYSLIHGQKLAALLIVNQSNMGLNLAEILNNIMIIVCNKADLPWEILTSAIDNFTGIYSTDTVPLMIFPHNYCEDKGVTFEKQYLLWLADIQYGDEYLEYMRNKMRMKIRFLLKFLIKTYLKQ